MKDIDCKHMIKTLMSKKFGEREVDYSLEGEKFHYDPTKEYNKHKHVKK